MKAQMTLDRTILYLPRRPFKVSFGHSKKTRLEKFKHLCQLNPDLRIEMNKEGEIFVMPPVHSQTSEKNTEIVYQLQSWAKKDKSGKVYESSGGFILPNGAVRSPDACWISKSRMEDLSEKERKGFMKICPDFVIELRSDSDSLPKLKAKMHEYIENGAKLGWLIDSIKKRVYVYRENQEVEILDHPKTLSGENILPAFELDLADILNKG